jgi:hypothetical protein
VCTDAQDLVSDILVVDTGGDGGANRFTTLTALLNSYPAVKLLVDAGDRTLFAPTDAAFQNIGINIASLPPPEVDTTEPLRTTCCSSTSALAAIQFLVTAQLSNDAIDDRR